MIERKKGKKEGYDYDELLLTVMRSSEARRGEARQQPQQQQPEKYILPTPTYLSLCLWKLFF
jgi:hypothetical protein